MLGGIHHRHYHRWLLELAGTLNLSQAVVFAGYVRNEETITYYWSASMFVCRVSTRALANH